MTADHKAAFLFFFRHPVDAISSKHIQFLAGTAKTKSSQYGSYLIFTVLVHRKIWVKELTLWEQGDSMREEGSVCFFSLRKDAL